MNDLFDNLDWWDGIPLFVILFMGSVMLFFLTLLLADATAKALIRRIKDRWGLVW